MSPKRNKRFSENVDSSRKRRTVEKSETKPKKLKMNKNEKQGKCNDSEWEEVDIDGKNNNEIEPPKNSGKSSNLDQDKEYQIDWPQKDLQVLVAKMELLAPEKDNISFATRAEKLNWEKVAFDDYTAAECKRTWICVQKRLRRFRILSEVLKDAREWISKPWTDFYKSGKTKHHPDMPRRPLSTYMLFYLQQKDEVIAKNPGIEMTDVSKKLSELYKTLPEEERAKYAQMALEKRKEYEEKLHEFYSNHPECLHQQDKIKERADIGPKKPLTPFMLFYKEHLKKASITDNSETKEFYRRQWDNMSDKKKVIWINWAAEEEAKYKDALKQYVSQHPDFVPPPIKPIITKKEKLLQERVAGKPIKPPNSAYSLYSRMMLQSDEIKSVNVRDRLNYISQQWKLCSEEEKQEYKERADHLMEQYKLDFASYLESLPEDKRAEELRNNMPKRKAKDSNLNNKKQKTEQIDDLLFKGEPKQPPLTAVALFKSTYTGDRPVKEAWRALSEKEHKKYANRVKKMKTKYIAEFEVFLKSLTKDEMKAYKKHRKEVEERTAALEKVESSDYDSESSET